MMPGNVVMGLAVLYVCVLVGLPLAMWMARRPMSPSEHEEREWRADEYHMRARPRSIEAARARLRRHPFRVRGH